MLAKLSKLAGFAVFALIGWWLWTGPIHDARTVTYEEQIEINDENMARCIGAEDYATNATGIDQGNGEENCAAKFGVYRDGLHWYLHDQPRRAKHSSAN